MDNLSEFREIAGRAGTHCPAITFRNDMKSILRHAGLPRPAASGESLFRKSTEKGCEIFMTNADSAFSHGTILNNDHLAVMFLKKVVIFNRPPYCLSCPSLLAARLGRIGLTKSENRA
ncbi:hypothetical protein [Gluconacetobacter tumulicola]|uniref:hypothetical protein n=1 Tax=Gluconacetobacter tumulicola TaxID=1017177 RepID=UPI0031EB1B60